MLGTSSTSSAPSLSTRRGTRFMRMQLCCIATLYPTSNVYAQKDNGSVRLHPLHKCFGHIYTPATAASPKQMPRTSSTSSAPSLSTRRGTRSRACRDRLPPQSNCLERLSHPATVKNFSFFLNSTWNFFKT